MCHIVSEIDSDILSKWLNEDIRVHVSLYSRLLIHIFSQCSPGEYRVYIHQLVDWFIHIRISNEAESISTQTKLCKKQSSLCFLLHSTSCVGSVYAYMHVHTTNSSRILRRQERLNTARRNTRHEKARAECYSQLERRYFEKTSEKERLLTRLKLLRAQLQEQEAPLREGLLQLTCIFDGP